MKNKLLKAIAWVTAILGILSACAVDSDSYIPTYILCACLAWWMLFAYANNWFSDYVDDYDDEFEDDEEDSYTEGAKIIDMKEHKKEAM